MALESGPEISTGVLPDRVAGITTTSASAASGPGGNGVVFPPEGVDFERVVAETEKRYLQAALERSNGVRTQAAELLKISYRSFRHFAKKHNL